jgi:hypothetical protein
VCLVPFLPRETVGLTVAVLGAVAVLPVLALSTAVLVSAVSTVPRRQQAAYTTLHATYAFLTANLRRRAALVPPMVVVTGRGTAR